jgi:hypothetical protein
MGSDPQANSRNSTRNVLNKHPSSGGSFAFARLRCDRLLASGLVNKRIIAEARSERLMNLERPVRASDEQYRDNGLSNHALGRFL